MNSLLMTKYTLKSLKEATNVLESFQKSSKVPKPNFRAQTPAKVSKLHFFVTNSQSVPTTYVWQFDGDRQTQTHRTHDDIIYHASDA